MNQGSSTQNSKEEMKDEFSFSKKELQTISKSEELQVLMKKLNKALKKHKEAGDKYEERAQKIKKIILKKVKKMTSENEWFP